MAGETTRRAAGGSVIGSAELCDRRFECDTDNVYDWFAVGPVFEDLGPRIVWLVAHVSCTEKTTNLEYGLRIMQSYDGREWAEGQEVLLDITDDGYTISAAVEDQQKLGRFMRFEVGVNSTDSVESAHLAVTIYWRYAT